ncbi:hypothetical protein ABG79_02260 [Caloramator mitchellensis]|uniref:Uncharacterized protein n=1 Tax=Caloramator mitchellensis TaxID=908809 RepID=A0A0R3JXW5_CALMK|nr:YkuS family protein [Caloramator mitchellensis]KRQ85956.1 hypothetical protein ABG79_02260 [Caloramator mitchellensis]
MTISIDDRLENLFNELKNLGYDVHKFSERVISDAYIYSEKDIPLYQLNNSLSAKDTGSLIINCDNLSLNDIIYSLHHKTYSPLF